MNELKPFVGFAVGLFVGLVLAAVVYVDARYERFERRQQPTVQPCPCGPDRPCPCPTPKGPRKGDLGDVDNGK